MPNFDKSASRPARGGFGNGPGGGNGKRYGKKDFGKGSFSGRDAGRPGMHKATCSTCGNSCEVPFKPTGSKPIYCFTCFKKDGNSEGKSNFRPASGRPSPSNYSSPVNQTVPAGNNNYTKFKEQFELVNSKLDNILKILTSPKPKKAIRAAVEKLADLDEKKK